MSRTHQTAVASSRGDQSGSDDKMVLTADQASKILKISISTLRRLTKEGTIPCKRIGRSVRYPVDALHNFVNDISTTKTA